ncbi:hypothetical protein K1W69_11710 [Hoeflea sp. WL0058]|uniref:Lipoyl-binding domain-containing protein n=1 Tax=Flavimaribacter sediminis TaxID=2865987 RepID=A0AAE2ZNK3_9HYPH|nr:biotin/lipoyl-containing protein [Flavimaribacter sediminis]MBW8637855.1 hypothetical protein [Flavimaribacter sediminis]
MIDITIPDVGEGVTEATIVQWNYAVGDTVEKGAVVVEVMTDKVNMEVETESAGFLTEILHGADEELPVGTVIGRIDPGRQS